MAEQTFVTKARRGLSEPAEPFRADAVKGPGGGGASGGRRVASIGRGGAEGGGNERGELRGAREQVLVGR